MRCKCEIGHINITTEVSLLSLNLAYLWEGHLDAALHVMGYLRLKYNSQLIFNPTCPNIDNSTFQHYDWEEFYGDIQEAIPTNAPPPLRKEVDLHMMVDRGPCRGQIDTTLANRVSNFLEHVAY
jgi:hypothetical protein